MMHLVAFSSPNHAGIYRIILSSDAPAAELSWINENSIDPIVIYRSVAFDVANAAKIDILKIVISSIGVPYRPGSRWVTIKATEMDALFDIYSPDQSVLDLPADEGSRSRSTEREQKIE
jgi:hypothetical protein